MQHDLYVDFIIDKIDTNLAFRCTFYDKSGEKLPLRGYTFYLHCKIKPGDIIEKKSKSDQITIYRKDSIGQKKKYLILQPD